MSLKIEDHKNSKRVKVIKIPEEDLDRLVFPFKKHSITSLEYKPFSRFTIAKSLDELFKNELSKHLKKVLNDRNSGTIIGRDSGNLPILFFSHSKQDNDEAVSVNRWPK